MNRTLLSAALLFSSCLASIAEEGFAWSNVNLRTGPGTQYDVIATIPEDDEIDIGECSVNWCQVTWRGMRGYASADHVMTEEEFEFWMWEEL